MKQAYTFNKYFKRWYGLRFGLFVVAGLVFLILLQTKENVADFFCDKWYHNYVKVVGEADTAEEKALKACEHGVRVGLWIVYFPLCAF